MVGHFCKVTGRDCLVRSGQRVEDAGRSPARRLDLRCHAAAVKLDSAPEEKTVYLLGIARASTAHLNFQHLALKVISVCVQMCTGARGGALSRSGGALFWLFSTNPRCAILFSFYSAAYEIIPHQTRMKEEDLGWPKRNFHPHRLHSPRSLRRHSVRIECRVPSVVSFCCSSCPAQHGC